MEVAYPPRALDHAIKVGYLLRTQSQARYQSWFVKHNLAPRVHWVSGIPFVIKGQNVQIMITMMDRVDLDMHDFLIRYWSDRKILGHLFSITLPSLIRFLSAHGITHGDFHTGNIVFKDGQVRLIDFAFTQPYADPGTDCCMFLYKIIRSFEPTIKAQTDQVSKQLTGLLMMFCVNILPILKEHSSWATALIEPFAQNEWTLQELYQHLSAHKAEFTNHIEKSYDQLSHYVQNHIDTQAPGDTFPKSVDELANLYLLKPFFWIPTSKGIQQRLALYKPKK
jgi:thiamine kinase-like enzyme